MLMMQNGIGNYAKDIALFCTVLKDLANELHFDSKSRRFRQDAFDTSLKIVTEYKAVFQESDEIRQTFGRKFSTS